LTKHRANVTLPLTEVLLEKPPIAQLLKNFPIFYGTGRFISRFKRSSTCSYPEPDKSNPYHFTVFL
jgi:hypothetical protein